MSDALQLSCWTLGDDPRQGVFNITIEKSGTTVSDLKVIIKQRLKNESIDAKSLILWKVNINLEEDLDLLKTIEVGSAVKGCEELVPWALLSNKFSDSNKQNKAHFLRVIVQRPIAKLVPLPPRPSTMIKRQAPSASATVTVEQQQQSQHEKKKKTEISKFLGVSIAKAVPKSSNGEPSPSEPSMRQVAANAGAKRDIIELDDDGEVMAPFPTLKKPRLRELMDMISDHGCGGVSMAVRISLREHELNCYLACESARKNYEDIRALSKLILKE